MAETLAQLRSWVELDWLFPIHSDEAHDHFSEKLDEEVGELMRALDTAVGIGDECGDVGFCSIALTTNASIGPQPLVNWQALVAGEGLTFLADIDEMAREWAEEHLGQDQLKVALRALCGRLTRNTGIYLRQAREWPEDAFTAMHGRRVTRSLVELLTLVSFIAQTRCGQSLATTMEQTKHKLASRKAAGEPITSIKSRTTET